MELRCNPAVGAAYSSAAQVARVVTEDWGRRNLFCAACSSNALEQAPANTKAFDYSCPACSERYQLKGMRRWNGERILDSAYSTMIAAIQSDATPNLLLLHYTPEWRIQQLLLLPRFFFSESIIEKRKPLAPTARRAGYVGCNIRIGLIPADGKIPIIEHGTSLAPSSVRERYGMVSGLGELGASIRGWTLDVLRCVRRLPPGFALADMYAFEKELGKLHPDNKNIRPKVRQQLQILRDLGLVRFVRPGRYESVRA